MARRTLFLFLGLLAVTSAVVFGRLVWAADTPTPTGLSEQVQQLMVRVTKLEARIAELESQPRRLIVPRPTPSLPPGMPKRSVPKEFDGMRYYIVPTETPMTRD